MGSGEKMQKGGSVPLDILMEYDGYDKEKCE